MFDSSLSVVDGDVFESKLLVINNYGLVIIVEDEIVNIVVRIFFDKKILVMGIWCFGKVEFDVGKRGGL